MKSFAFLASLPLTSHKLFYNKTTSLQNFRSFSVAQSSSNRALQTNTRNIFCAKASSEEEKSVSDLLQSPEFFERVQGVNKAKSLGQKQALELLLPLVNDPNLNVRYAAVSQLADVGVADPEATLTSIRVLLGTETDTSIRSAAADAINSLGLKEGFDLLKNLYEETDDWMMKFSIVAGLGELGDERAFDLLVDALNQPDAMVQVAAVGALGDLGDPRAIPLVENYLDSDDINLKERASIALSQLKK